MVNLEKYLTTFRKLRIDRAHGIAPHKPVLLLSLLQSFQRGFINTPKIYITPELVSLFKSNWSLLVNTKHDCHFSLPFYHLTSDHFWKLIPKPGFESIIKIKTSMRSFANLNSAIDYAFIDHDLYLLMMDQSANEIMQKSILDTYFQETSDNFRYSSSEQQGLFDDIEGKILHENPLEYIRETKELMQQQNEEEIFLRGSLFKREIPKIYNNTCCISGMKIDATISVSMIDACHIVPFKQSFNDTISNGLALCPNLHRAFDRGLITIDSSYKVVVSKVFKEKDSNYSILGFEGKKILLPAKEDFFPSKDNLNWHIENIFKK